MVQSSKERKAMFAKQWNKLLPSQRLFVIKNTRLNAGGFGFQGGLAKLKYEQLKAREIKAIKEDFLKDHNSLTSRKENDIVPTKRQIELVSGKK